MDEMHVLKTLQANILQDLHVMFSGDFHICHLSTKGF